MAALRPPTERCPFNSLNKYTFSASSKNCFSSFSLGCPFSVILNGIVTLLLDLFSTGELERIKLV